MMNYKNKIPTKFLWVDLEMTGLDEHRDVILEVFAVITDSQLVENETYEARIYHSRDELVGLMSKNDFWATYSKNRDNFLDHAHQGIPLSKVEQDLIQLVKKHFVDERAILAGNSIHCDKKFIEKYMPKLNSLLHYRLLDVSSWKVALQAMYGLVYDKPDIHRAHEDVQASIKELQYYIDWLRSS